MMHDAAVGKTTGETAFRELLLTLERHRLTFNPAFFAAIIMLVGCS
jgi:hypothetical protein